MWSRELMQNCKTDVKRWNCSIWTETSSLVKVIFLDDGYSTCGTFWEQCELHKFIWIVWFLSFSDCAHLCLESVIFVGDKFGATTVVLRNGKDISGVFRWNTPPTFEMYILELDSPHTSSATLDIKIIIFTKLSVWTKLVSSSFQQRFQIFTRSERLNGSGP